MKTSVKRRAKNCIRGAVLLACFIAVWYVASCFTQPLFIPAPATVWEAIVGLAETGQLQKGLAYSFLRITGASALSMLVAIPLSLLIYGVKPIKETIMSVVSFLRYVPVTAFSPLLILWFGIGEQMKISFLFIATFVYLLPSILLCFNDVPQDLMDTGKTIGMTSWETIKEILLPASLPSIFSTFLMMYGIGWTYCAVVEATNAKYGLGFIINVSSARGRTAVVFGAIIVIMLFSFVFDKLGNLLIRKIFQWRYCSVMPMFAGVSDEEIKAQCGDAEMMGYAENKEVLDSTAPSVYFDMCDIWESLGETVNRKVAMTLFDNQYLLPLASKYSSTSTSTSKPVELTEEQKQEIVNYEALLTKSMTVEFVADTAQFKNPEEAYAIMDEFVSIANTLDGAIIQVEGNINARNYSDSGQALSAERAKAVAKYFIACGIDPNRLITVGNGNTKMVADPGSADAYLNRRTDVFFKIIEE